MMRMAKKLAAALLLTMVATAVAAPQEAGSSTAGLLSDPGATFKQSAPLHGWSVIGYGDMRFTDPKNEKVTNPAARRALVAKIAEERPDALLLSGDVPYDGKNSDDYTIYHAETEAWRQAGMHIYPALGNHELHGGSSLENWWAAFPELKQRRWYSVEFGSAYFIALDSNLDLTADSVQGKWLAGQIEQLPKSVKYVFVAIHHPPMADPIAGNDSHNVRPNEIALGKQLEAAAARSKVRFVVIAGHIHAYQRFERNGVVYLVSGGGGAAQHHIARTKENLYQDDVFPNFHYVKFVEGSKGVEATMYHLDDKGGFIASDHFTLTPAR